MLKTSGCRKCGGRPVPRDESVFKLCQYDIDVLRSYVTAPLFGDFVTNLSFPDRSRVVRQRYRGAVRLLGW